MFTNCARGGSLLIIQQLMKFEKYFSQNSPPPPGKKFGYALELRVNRKASFFFCPKARGLCV